MTVVHVAIDTHAQQVRADGAWRHGMVTDEAIAARRKMAKLLREAGKVIAALRGGSPS